MKTPANYRNTAPAAQPAPGHSLGGAWLPAQVAMPRALDLSHWLSRAARGHTWNGHGATQRRRPN